MNLFRTGSFHPPSSNGELPETHDISTGFYNKVFLVGIAQPSKALDIGANLMDHGTSA
jgi:hypothetical protein